jgi:hypothetical protein
MRVSDERSSITCNHSPLTTTNKQSSSFTGRAAGRRLAGAGFVGGTGPRTGRQIRALFGLLLTQLRNRLRLSSFFDLTSAPGLLILIAKRAAPKLEGVSPGNSKCLNNIYWIRSQATLSLGL